jgi:hypothetical protein
MNKGPGFFEHLIATARARAKVPKTESASSSKTIVSSLRPDHSSRAVIGGTEHAALAGTGARRHIRDRHGRDRYGGVSTACATIDPAPARKMRHEEIISIFE